MTVVGYFNATRELAGMRRYLDDDVTTRVRRHGRARGMSDRIVSGSRHARDRGADLADLLGRHQQRAQAAGGRLRRRTWTPRPGGEAISEEYAAARKEKRDPHALVDRFYQRGEPEAFRSMSCWPRACCRSAWTCPGSG